MRDLGRRAPRPGVRAGTRERGVGGVGGHGGHERAERGVEPEVVGGDHHDEGHDEGVDRPEHLEHAVLHEHDRRHRDHQRERHVHARHRGERVVEHVGALLGVLADEARDRVAEAPLGQEARRRGGVRHVADQREAHRDHEHVAHEVEGVVARDVEPDQERRRDHEVRVHVHPAGERDDPVLALGPGLEARLEEEPERALGVDEVARVLERERRPGRPRCRARSGTGSRRRRTARAAGWRRASRSEASARSGARPEPAGPGAGGTRARLPSVAGPGVAQPSSQRRPREKSRSGAKRVDMCTKPDVLRDHLRPVAVRLDARVRGEPVGRPAHLHDRLARAASRRAAARRTGTARATMRASPCGITSGAGSSTSYTRQSSDFQRSRR